MPPKPSQKAIQQYKQFNGSGEDEKKLVEKAMKLSLTAVSEKPPQRDYPIPESQIGKPLKVPKPEEKK